MLRGLLDALTRVDEAGEAGIHAGRIPAEGSGNHLGFRVWGWGGGGVWDLRIRVWGSLGLYTRILLILRMARLGALVTLLEMGLQSPGHC